LKTSDNARTTLLSRDTDGGLSIVPLGGLGEIGMNCMLYEQDETIMIVDCGINFPEEDDYGIDLIIPSFAYLVENAKNLEAIVITHGHEDHIGAIPYLLREVNAPIYGPPLALAMIARKLKEHGLYDDADLREVGPGDTFDVGPFNVEMIHVNHSTPQCCSLAIKSDVGTLIHTGDFKVEHDAVDEEPIDLARFAALGDEGVLCLLSDSTNVGRPGTTNSEATVAANLEEVISGARGRVIVTLFASNLRRLQSLLDIAHETGRRVALLGRSLLRNLEIGRELGLVHLPDEGLLIEPDELEVFRHDQLLIMCTGSQGEPRSALTRVAMGDHRSMSVLPGDLVLFSSRVIPGNETSVSRVKNHLYRRGAAVYSGPHFIHVSGHACQEEQKLLLNLIRPDIFVPIHGEYRHLARHAKLAEQLGVSEAFIMQNGDALTLWEDDAEVSHRVAAGRVLVDGKGTDELPSPILQDRRKLARTGIVVAWLVLDASTGDVVDGPRLISQGVIQNGSSGTLDADAGRAVLEAIDELSVESRREATEVAEAMRRAVRRCYNRHLETKPVVVPIVHEL